MSALLHIGDQIDGTNALIARYESALAQPDSSDSLRVGLRSLKKLRRRLEEQFETIAAESEIELYRYRIIPEGRATLEGLGQAWSSFQGFFSSVYRGLSSETRRDEKTAPVDIAPFGFAYTFPGSVGVALTLPSKDGLFEDPLVIEATEKVFDLSESIERRTIEDAAQRMGPDVVRAMHTWVDALVTNNYGAGLEWRERSVTVDPARLGRLRELVTLSTTTSTITVTGKLELVDAAKKRFRLIADTGDKYEGGYGEAISEEHAASVPFRYEATIRKIVKVIREPKEPEASFELVDLRIPPRN